MRKICVIVTLILPLVVGAKQASDTAKQILERAIKSHGGKAALSKLLSCRVKYKGVHRTVDGREITFSSEFVFRRPDSFKDTLWLERKI